MKLEDAFLNVCRGSTSRGMKLQQLSPVSGFVRKNFVEEIVTQARLKIAVLKTD